MHGALIVAVCVFSATQFAGADVKIVSEMIKSNANIKKHIYAYTYIYIYIYIYKTHMIQGIKKISKYVGIGGLHNKKENGSSRTDKSGA